MSTNFFAFLKVITPPMPKYIPIFKIVSTKPVTSPELESAVKPLINMGASVVFECEKLEYISSAGLRVVLATHKQLTACAGKFAIRHLNREVRSVFDITGFSKILNIEE